MKKLSELNKEQAQVIQNVLDDESLGKKRYLIALMKYMEYPSFLFFRNSEEYLKEYLE